MENKNQEQSSEKLTDQDDLLSENFKDSENLSDVGDSLKGFSPSEIREIPSLEGLDPNFGVKRGPGRPKSVKNKQASENCKQQQKSPYNLRSRKENCSLTIGYDSVYPTVEEALSGPHRAQWKKEMDCEIGMLQEKGAWVIVD